ncbi:GspH/FimT family pseudopilin [Pseudomonas sp. B11D7D]|nr:GspH/FimT family pseudopilin [Pseudomonas sp. B11D7D]QNH05714.1 GspH/FimT family pseudopilin [Pseudomonas sp. B11D7D]
MSHHSDMRGFSLIELMIVLALLAIAVGIAIPNFARLVANNQIEAQAQTLNSLLQFARSQAVVRRTSIRLRNDNNNWIVENASDNTALRQETFNPQHANITSSLAPVTLTFTSNGSAETASFVICRDDKAAFAYRIEVQPSGSTRLMPRGKDDQGNDLGDCQP